MHCPSDPPYFPRVGRYMLSAHAYYRTTGTTVESSKNALDHMDVVLIYLAIKCCSWGEARESLYKYKFGLVSLSALLSFWVVTLLGRCSDHGLHNIAIVVLRTMMSVKKSVARVCCAQDTMEPSHPKSMLSCNSLGLFLSRFCHSRLSRLTLYRRWATITYPSHVFYACLSLLHPLVGCPHLPYMPLLPRYRVPDSPHICNFLTSSPSHG